MAATRMAVATLGRRAGVRTAGRWAVGLACVGLLVGCSSAPVAGSASPAQGCANAFDDSAIRADRVAVPYLDAARGSCVPLTASDLIEVGEWVCALSSTGASKDAGVESVVRQMEPALTEGQAAAVVSAARGQLCPVLGNRSYLDAVRAGG